MRSCSEGAITGSRFDIPASGYRDDVIGAGGGKGWWRNYSNDVGVRVVVMVGSGGNDTFRG